MLLRLWSSAKPECYNIKNLKRVLAAEGLHHMWLWISLMTQRQSPQLVSRKIKEANKTSASSSPRTYSRLDHYNSGYTSCPTTPINNRKKFDFNFT